jgi:hypothetical protein
MDGKEIRPLAVDLPKFFQICNCIRLGTFRFIGNRQ